MTDNLTVEEVEKHWRWLRGWKVGEQAEFGMRLCRAYAEEQMKKEQMKLPSHLPFNPEKRAEALKPVTVWQSALNRMKGEHK